MQKFNYKDEPLKIFGLPHFEKTKELRRLPDETLEKLPNLSFLGKRCPGARLCFKTDSLHIKLKIRFETLSFDIGMSIFSCQAAAVLAGERSSSRFLGLCYPPDYETKEFEREFDKGSREFEDITVYLPRNEIIADINIFIDDGAKIAAPTPYKYPVPIVYYGSSITEGGCCCNIFNYYNAIISRHLDTDFINLGFSGSARGELSMADFINTLDMSIFVYDYDHNAPNPDELLKTHEPFFKRIREKHPDVPVVMMSMPKVTYDEENVKRRDIIYATYQNAVNSGDENVYFIDGETFYGESDRELCSIDTVHPNDLGFYRMAEVIEPVIKKILKKTNFPR